LPATGLVVFFVDDQVFVRLWNGTVLPGVSLRLGLNLLRDYNADDASQPTPPYKWIAPGMIAWRWTAGELSWGYPLSLDGHVFDLAEFRPMVDAITFISPNTLESELQRYAPTFREQRLGFCYEHSRVVNVPWNLVQTDWRNRNAGMDADGFLTQWESGHRIALQGIYDGMIESVHQVFPLQWEAR